LNTLSFYN